MTAAQPVGNLDGYLAALNTALAVGWRSRSRILEEAGEHLYQAALAEHEHLLAQVERGEHRAQPDEALWVQSQQRAIAAFGSPEEFAAGFHTGPLGALDRRLALADGCVETWLGRRPILGATIWAGALSLSWIALGAAILFAGDLFGVGYAFNVLLPLVLVSVVMFVVRMVSVLRGKLPVGGVARWRGLPLCQPRGARLVALRDWGAFIFFMGYVMLTDPMSFTQLVGAWIAVAVVVEMAARLARRTGHGAGWSAYGSDPDENWTRYVTGLWTSAAITLSLIVVAADSPGLAATLGGLLVAITATTALARRLAWNSSVKRNWGRTYEARAAAR